MKIKIESTKFSLDGKRMYNTLYILTPSKTIRIMLERVKGKDSIKLGDVKVYDKEKAI